MLVVAAALLVLGYLRLTGPSIALAALAVPLLYVLYLYEVEVYVDANGRTFTSTSGGSGASSDLFPLARVKPGTPAKLASRREKLTNQWQAACLT